MVRLWSSRVLVCDAGAHLLAQLRVRMCSCMCSRACGLGRTCGMMLWYAQAPALMHVRMI